LLQAFRALTRVAAPGLLFKAEAIVSPPQLIPYLGRGFAANKECELAYHNVLMVLIWSALAERRVTLMTRALQELPALPENSAWVTYVRCHDDIGWAVTDEDAAAVGLSGPLHRAFLSDFYSGRFPQSFARGATFQFNPKTGDRRISGSAASLAGLETAIEARDPGQVELALGRLLLAHNIILAFGGVPLIYMGDELGFLNDYSYVNQYDHADDNRWLHRPLMDWDRAEERCEWQSLSGRVFQGLQQLVATRQKVPALHAQALSRPVWTHNDAVFGLVRDSARGRILVLANFSETAQSVPAHRLGALGFAGTSLDHLTGQSHHGWHDVALGPYQAVWLESVDQ
jgi:amylosucrase